jgi:hypothetical protein
LIRNLQALRPAYRSALPGPWAALALFLLGASIRAVAVEAPEDLFRKFRPALFQVTVIDLPSSNRSGLGSGFPVADDLVATNFHVISQYLDAPTTTSIRLVADDDDEIPAQVVAVDAVNDLAILRVEQALPLVMSLASEPPAIGSRLLALGNPYDLGMSVTEGIFNGIKEGAFPTRIHYSGPVNPGMSGGPTVNPAGAVVGINVATARNSVGFLVPVAALRELLPRVATAPMDETAILAAIGAQLYATQQLLMDELMREPWPMETFGGASVPDKTASFISCWGHSDEDDDSGVNSVSRGCNSDQPLRISSRLSTGYVEYEFNHLHTNTLQPVRLYNLAQRHFGGARPGNEAGEEHVTNFHCVENHLQTGQPPGRQFRIHFCSRAYLDFRDLFDAFYVGVSTDKADEILFSHFTLSGFSQDNIQRFLERFIGSVQ